MTQEITGTNIDFIGDIHGYADKLESLLCKLGYDDSSGVYQHPDRKAFFLGDFIDRGPDNPRVVRIARQMVEAGYAYAIQGNHEYNAVTFNLLGDDGYLRPHSIKNITQHTSTLLQYHHKQKEYDSDIAWYKSLPLYIETEGFRAVHAAWDQTSIDILSKETQNGILSDDQWHESAKKDAKLADAVEKTCKGIELSLPPGKSFSDKDGTVRHDIRIAWWQNPNGKSYEDMSVIKGLGLEDVKFESDFDYYQESERPIFFGHYWLNGIPTLQKHNVCCLDFSVAKDGYLCAYQWDGEQTLDNDKIIYV
jgi:hypothetical protein